MTRLTRRSSLLTLVGTLCAGAAFAGTVTVTLKSASGTAVTDTIVVFDPLDSEPAVVHEKAVIDQVNKRFVPRVSVVRTGTAVTFPNSDRVRHQVYSFSPAKPFSLKLYAGSPPADVVFDKAGLVALGCNIHDSMVGFVAVVDSPYFAKVADTGSATLIMPPGRYKLRIWNAGLTHAVPPLQIAVSAAPLTIPVTIEVDPERDTVADWP